MSDGGDRLARVDGADVLELPLYSVTEAGRLLGVQPVTLKRWLEGYSARGTSHLPIIRPERSGSDSVTWGEFVEAGFLHEYRTRIARQKPSSVSTSRRAHAGQTSPTRRGSDSRNDDPTFRERLGAHRRA